jgi:hypothetical protein
MYHGASQPSRSGGERPDQERGAGEAEAEHGEPDPEGTFAHLRQPEPDVERRQEEEEGEWIRRNDDEGGNAEREERRRVAGELLFRPDGPARDQAVARHEPAEEGQERERDQAARRPADVGERGRARVRGETLKRLYKDTARDAREKLAEYARLGGFALASGASALANRSTEAARKGRSAPIRRSGRPAAHDPAAEIDVARGPGASATPLHRVEGVLGRAADLAETARPTPPRPRCRGERSGRSIVTAGTRG